MPAYYTNKNGLAIENRHSSFGHRLMAVVIICSLVAQGLFVDIPQAEAATYTFVQSSFSGGTDTGNFPTHTGNRTNWTKYYNADASVTNSGGTLAMTASAANATTTKNLFSEFAAGATSTLVYAGAQGTGAGVTLCTYDHAGADWTPTDNDSYDLNGATAGIYIAGVHCNVGVFTVPSGTVYVQAYDGSKYGSLTIFSRTVTVTGTLSGANAGYTAATGPGAGTSGSGDCGSPSGSGAGYGGPGGYGSNTNTIGGNYGSTLAPYQMGSGGGSSGCATGGSGGALVRIFSSGAMAINGTITVSGGNGGNNNASSGGGSGGAIYLDAGSVSGSGSLTAAGGDNATGGGGTSGAGGGGIVALHYNSSTYSGSISVAAGSGSGTNAGSAGSVLLVDDDDSSLVISKGPFRFTTDNNSTYNFSSVTITSSQAARATVGQAITFTTGSLTIDAGATLTADNAGYAPATGPGAGTSSGANCGGSSAGGGAHGGAGAASDTAGGSTYDTVSAPTMFGSGGGSTSCTSGGYGGGLITIRASGTSAINGTVTANGGAGGANNASGGGGAGGGIYITTYTLSGSGSITANGGNGGVSSGTGGGGGGGIIAIHYNSNTFSGTTTATKGTGGTGGGNGAVNTYADVAIAHSPLAYIDRAYQSASSPITDIEESSKVTGIHRVKVARESLPSPPIVQRVTKFFGIIFNQLRSFVMPERAFAASGSGTFESATIDLNTTTATFNQLTVASSTSGGATIQIQVAGNTNGSTWNYIGPDGTSGTYFTKAITALPSGLNNSRYVRFKATLTASETYADVPILNAVSFSYSTNDYPSEATVVSSPFNAEDSANIMSKIAWTATTPTNTTVKFQVRTAPNSSGSPGTWSSYYGPDGTSSSYFTTAAGTDAMPSAFTDLTNDQWFQYKAFLASSDGASTPTLSAVTVTYVVNAAPDFNTGYGTTGVIVSQVATTTDANWGKVEISYSVRDTDTTTGTVNAGYVTPSFEYNLSDGSGWQTITSGYLSNGALSNKAVDVSTYITYTAYWNAQSQIANVATTTAQIRVTINDNESANNTATAAVTGVSIDTKVPVLSVGQFNSALGQMTLMASDTANSIQYNLSNSSTVVADGTNNISGSWQSVGAISTSTTFSWTGSGSSASEPVYLVVRDAYNNAIATTTIRAPKVPSSIEIKDASNVTTGEYRLITSWPVYTSESGATFSGYEVSRSTNGTDYSLLTTVTDRTQNYHLDTGLATTSTYYYKTVLLDTDGDRSRYTSAVSETPNGVNSISNDNVAPTITAVSYGTPQSTYAVITWTTDEAANSKVDYSTAAANSFASMATSSSYVSSHSVTLSGLTSGTAYVFRAVSTDLAGNAATSTSGSYAFTTATAMAISSVTATDLADNSATITWTTDANSDSYVVYARSTANLASGTNATTTGSASLVGGSGPTYAHSVGLSSLLENTTYYYYVKSTDAAGNTITNNNGGSYYSFLTTYDTAGPVISGVTVALKTSDSAVITWATDEASDSQVSWGATAGSLTSSSTRNSTLTLNHSATMSSLGVSTKYYYQVNSADSHGNRATSTEDNLTTTAGDQTITRIVSAGGGGVSSVIGVEQKEYDKVKSERDKLKGEKDTSSPVITSVQVSDIKPFSATVAIGTNESALPIVQFGTTKELLDKTVSGKAYDTTAAIPLYGLRFGTEYYMNIIATDKAGNISTATTTEFKTLYAAEGLTDISKLENAENFQDQLENIIDSVMPSLNPPFLTDLKVDEVTEDSATLSWSTNTKTYGSVFYAAKEELKNALGTDAYAKSISDTNDKTQTHTVKLSNLSPLTEYHAMATSFAIFGVNGQNKDTTFVTKAPKIRPEILSVGNTNFSIFWKTTDPTTSVVEFRNVRTGEAGTVSMSDYVTSHTVAVEGLSPDTTYEVSLYGVAKNGGVAQAPQKLSVRTKFDNKPPKITNVNISNAFIPNDSTRLQTVIAWKTDEAASGAITFEEGTGVNFVKSTTVPDTTPYTTNHALVLSRLKPGTIYRLQIASADEAGNRASTTIKTIITPRAPESVFNVIIKNFEDTFGYLKSN